MHPALNLPEIVREILNHLDREEDVADDALTSSGHRHGHGPPGNGNGGGGGTVPSTAATHNTTTRGLRYAPAYVHSLSRASSLLAAALCCKLWERPALDCLWREMRGIMPLLRMAPGFMTLEDGTIIIPGRLNEKSCPRFHEYRRRIQHLEIDALKVEVDFVNLHHSTILRLGQFKDGFLPCLRSLRIRADEAASVSLDKTIMLLPSLFKSPELRTFGVFINPQSDIDSPPDWLGPICTLLMDANPNLRLMRLTGHLPPQYAHCLGEWQNLRTLSLNLATENWSLGTIQALCTLPELSELRADFKDTLPFPNFDPASMGSSPFPRLSKLIIMARLGFAIQFLDILPSDQLGQVNIRRSRGDFEGRPRNRSEECNEWKTFCQKLSRFRTSLKSISMDWSTNTSQRNNLANHNNNANAQNGNAPNIGCLSIIESLLCLSNLATFQVKSLPQWLALGDRDIDRMATNFPRLESLYLGYTIPPTVDARPSLEALGILARKCPRLDRLSILLGNNEDSGSANTDDDSDLDTNEGVRSPLQTGRGIDNDPHPLPPLPPSSPTPPTPWRRYNPAGGSSRHSPSPYHAIPNQMYEGRIVGGPWQRNNSPFSISKSSMTHPNSHLHTPALAGAANANASSGAGGNTLVRIQDLPPLSHNLRHLDLRETKFVSPMTVARSIDKLFPNLQTLSVHDAEQAFWMKMTVFQICQPVRKDQQWRDEESFRRRVVEEWMGPGAPSSSGDAGEVQGAGESHGHVEKRGRGWSVGGSAVAESSSGGGAWKSRQFDGGWVGME
ncbi:hypothetical protein AX16_006636 [Volvariella volvacea WC 439]|nr:hypothetical protein AX16_006636 [Volvariella volvacea WC 439]